MQLTGSYFPIRDELASLAVQVQSPSPWTARELHLFEFLCNHPSMYLIKSISFSEALNSLSAYFSYLQDCHSNTKL